MLRGTRVGLLSVAMLPFGIGIAVQGAPEPTFQAVQTPAGDVSYEQQIGPIFMEHCSECHGHEEPEAGLKLISYEDVMTGSEYGTVIEAGDPDGSLLLEMVVNGEMPQDKDPVPDDQIDLIRNWILQGAENN